MSCVTTNLSTIDFHSLFLSWSRLSHASDRGRIDGEMLRVDTTAVETNIHYPTDSSLLWDSYRVLTRLITTARVEEVGKLYVS